MALRLHKKARSIVTTRNIRHELATPPLHMQLS